MAARLTLPLIWLTITMVACAPTLPEPVTGAHEGGVPVPVPFFPPAARVDIVGSPPAKMQAAEWVDGQWLWQGRRWIWEPGLWVERDDAKVYAEPIVVRRADGQLVWFKGTFRPKRSGVDTP